eukprot:15348790-Ditylum_brightwellii.AAC.1
MPSLFKDALKDKPLGEKEEVTSSLQEKKKKKKDRKRRISFSLDNDDDDDNEECLNKISDQYLSSPQYQSNHQGSMVQRMEKEENIWDVLIFDTGGGHNNTIAKKAWHVFEKTICKQYLCGYGNNRDPKECQIINAAAKAFIPRKEIPIILVVNYATLNEDPDEVTWNL